MKAKKTSVSAPAVISLVVIISLIIAILFEITSCVSGTFDNTGVKPETTDGASSTDPSDGTTDASTDEQTIGPLVPPDTDEETPEVTDPLPPDTTDTEPPVTDEATTDGPDTTSPPDTTEEETTVYVNDGHDVVLDALIITGNRAMEYYYCSEKYTKQYAMLVNKYAADLEGIAKVYSCVVPKAAAFYMQDTENHGKLQAQTTKALGYISETLSPSVIDVDLYSALLPHRDEDIYFRTDHHWTGLGAYYAAEAIAEAAGVGFDDLSTYTVNTREGYLGSMYKYSDYHPRIEQNPDDFVTYVPTTPYVSYMRDYSFENPEQHGVFYEISESRVAYWYSTYILGDSGSFHIKTEVNNGRKLLIIKDSFGNALAPYFMSSFEEIMIVDFRYFKKNVIDFVKDNGITDVAIVLNTFNAGSTPNTQLEVLRTQK